MQTMKKKTRDLSANLSNNKGAGKQQQDTPGSDSNNSGPDQANSNPSAGDDTSNTSLPSKGSVSKQPNGWASWSMFRSNSTNNKKPAGGEKDSGNHQNTEGDEEQKSEEKNNSSDKGPSVEQSKKEEQQQQPAEEEDSPTDPDNEGNNNEEDFNVRERSSWYGLFKKKTPGTVTPNTPYDSSSDNEGSQNHATTTEPPHNGKNNSRTWAFWSSGKGKNNNNNNNSNNGEEGELAVTGEDSQDHPKHARLAARPDTDTEPDRPKQQQKKQKTIKPNIVAPSTDECFPMYTQSQRFRSSMQRLSEYLTPGSSKASTQILYHDSLYLSAPKKIHKVVVVGVHGFFPAKMVRSILGAPRGTSLKFADEAASAVQRWADEKGIDVEIEKIALEGEGKVMNRVEKLYELLQNWISHIEEADFVFFASHSQGTPVAVHLLARLVEDGHLEKHHQLIALLGMAGISLGPMSGLDQTLMMRAYSSIESASLSELFQFQDLQSFQSRKYLDSLRTIIAHNCKIVFMGSMNDQLVPLYSSTCIHLSHPNIYRAVYVDGQDVAPEFVSTLVTLALRLRNVGSSDHGVIKEISGALSGTLTGGGHSKVYDEPEVYDLALRHALETTDPAANTPVRVADDFAVPKANSTHNPYLLPWCMRGLLGEAMTREPLTGHLDLLYNEFETWKPDSKPLKDLKYRLSAIQSKL